MLNDIKEWITISQSESDYTEQAEQWEVQACMSLWAALCQETRVLHSYSGRTGGPTSKQAPWLIWRSGSAGRRCDTRRWSVVQRNSLVPAPGRLSRPFFKTLVQVCICAKTWSVSAIYLLLLAKNPKLGVLEWRVNKLHPCNNAVKD